MKSILERFIPYDTNSHELPQILTICVACLSSFTVGLLFTWTSPSIPILISNASHIEPLTLEEASYFTVIPPIAAILTGPIFAAIVDIFGRRKTVMFIAIPQIISFVLIALAEHTTTFYIARCITGIADAVHFNVLPMYVGEIAVPRVRGLWGNLIAINNYLGGFVINIIGSNYGIRTTACICVCIPIVQFILIGFLPESPYFLLMKNRVEEAEATLRKLNWKENVDEELLSLKNDVQRQISESGTFKDLFTISTNRKALLVSMGIRASQQFSGLVAFTLYTQYMFNQAGSNLSAYTSTIIFSGTLVTLISISAFVVDKFGRRPLMMFSCSGCGIIVAFEAVYFYIYQKTNLDVSPFSWVPLGGMLVYIFMCASGLAILPTLMLGELFSASIKGKALYIANIFFSLCTLSVSKIFQTLASNFGMYVPFCFFTICCCLSFVFSYYCVPETKGKTLEEIQQSLRGRKTEKAIASGKDSLSKI